MLTPKNKVIVYAQDSFGVETAKTGIGFIRYGLCETVGVVDKRLAGKTTTDVFKPLPPIKIFNSIEEAKKARPDADVLLIGIAPSGGQLPKEWVDDIKVAINLKLNIVSGLHDFIEQIPEVKSQASKAGVFIWDLRKNNSKHNIANARLLDYPVKVILTVGTDASVGKMTVALELTKSAKKLQKPAKFIATGQTGMVISGSGVPIDAIVGDFMAGAIEEEIIKASKQGCNIVFVEGQGSILHPGFSGVTLALFHGAMPHKLILCHKVGLDYLRNTKIKIQSLRQFINIYENVSIPLREAKVVGIGLNTATLNDYETKEAIKAVEGETGLLADDTFKHTGDKLIKTCLE